MKYKIWDMFKDRFLTEGESYCFGIGSDGKLYEFDFGACGESAWLNRKACPEHYEIHMEDD
ncbi:hypothetical protein G7L40_20435 [Paenibacillus polymyxa]|uniref:Uncharacterized protein n=1 Tax=Paenibacillus polymyxa TaxID=1406 RepID=A0A378XYZ7_PAEPO|nr:hypothetical protein [Paenibacillus polymyxa]MBE7896142.1 hypothetical protein [Paenibacillus polymyxa]MBG9765913.1 hypothetical protein [Paenibacillus polymyxa]MCC3256672.1 hypothetical protein [Paenibacillus polymyxa]QPK54837.1 hypothetical protein G7035_20480 [Paenibacillus polymyxa]QPK59927.1 hypothetical protein G7L40_20435 [Paenibacillus polymyxa]